MGQEVLQSGPIALYGQLAAIFRDKIKSGVWPNGSEIPTLEELTIEYSLARVTVRQAIQVLVGEGLLSSHRGRRTIVTHEGDQLDPEPLFTSINFTDSTTGNYEVSIISQDRLAGENIPPPFMGKTTGEFVLLRKIDIESGSPYSTSLNYISARIFDRFPQGAPAVTKVARLVRDYGREDFTKCIERISVRAAEAEIASRLDIQTGSPVAVAERAFTDDADNIAYFGQLFYPASRFGIERDVTAAIRG